MTMTAITRERVQLESVAQQLTHGTDRQRSPGIALHPSTLSRPVFDSVAFSLYFGSIFKTHRQNVASPTRYWPRPWWPTLTAGSGTPRTGDGSGGVRAADPGREKPERDPSESVANPGGFAAKHGVSRRHPGDRFPAGKGTCPHRGPGKPGDPRPEVEVSVRVPSRDATSVIPIEEAGSAGRGAPRSPVRAISRYRLGSMNSRRCASMFHFHNIVRQIRGQTPWTRSFANRVPVVELLGFFGISGLPGEFHVVWAPR